VDVLTYLRENWERLRRGERLSVEDGVLTALLSLAAAVVLVPMAVSGAFTAYEEGKKRGWWR